MKLSRRDFLKKSSIFIFGLSISPIVLDVIWGRKKSFALKEKGLGLREAMHYAKLTDEAVQCKLCPRYCTLMNNQRSFCRVREPRDGKLYTLVYELPCAVHTDPIEKKPIFHMLPGSRSFSIATAGCNLPCKFCQNWQISQSSPEETSNIRFSCEQVVEKARNTNCRSIAYTYSEPIIFYEYVIDTAKLAKSRGIKNILVTAGYINPIPLKELCKYIDAANIDLKGFNPRYLREVCAQELGPLLEAIKIARQCGVWIEITNLIVPTLNDDMNWIKKMCFWIKEELGEETPLHFSRFWPMYKLKNLPPTPVKTMEEARRVAIDAGLFYVYLGNVPGHEGNNTFCPSCKKVLIKRTGYLITENNLTGSRCKSCGHEIAGIWM